MTRKDLPKALKAIKALAGKETIKDGSGRHFSWVSPEFVNAKTFEFAMEAWRWEIFTNKRGDVEGISFTGDKLGDDLVLFEAIAPFVQKMSYIEMGGEDGLIWRWVFDGKFVEEKHAVLTWE